MEWLTMMYDGIKFRLNRAYAWRSAAHDDRYTEFYSRRTGKALEADSYPLTNMTVMADGRAFLAYDGLVYASAKR